MPKIPSLTAEKVIRILLKNGFVPDHQTGSHLVFYNKKTKKRVVVPYHGRESPRGTLLSMRKDGFSVPVREWMMEERGSFGERGLREKGNE